MSRPATPKQVRFIESLFAQCEQALSALDADTASAFIERIVPVQPTIVSALAGHEIDMADASTTIEALMAVQRDAKAKVPAPETPPGIAEMNVERWMPNKYANACSVCSERVAEGQGFVVLRGRWLPLCSPCAHSTQADRTDRADALRAVLAEIETLSQQVLDAMGRGDQKQPNVGLAIADSTGQNDLRFYRVTRRDRVTQVWSVIGGRDDAVMAPEQALDALRAIVAVDIEDAARTYGRELGQCCLCGRHLTDESSRAAGIGPDCMRRL